MTIILSIFLLSLTLLPCDDMQTEDNCGTESHYHLTDNHDHDADADLCSPFCQCHCCHTHITAQQSPPLSATLAFISESTSGYIPNIGKDIADSLLQPPQV